MKCTFTLPNQGTFFLAPLSTEKISEACSLCDECVGENLYRDEEIAAIIGASDSFFYFLKKQGEKVLYDNTEPICPYCKGRCLCDEEVYYKLL